MLPIHECLFLNIQGPVEKLLPKTIRFKVGSLGKLLKVIF